MLNKFKWLPIFITIAFSVTGQERQPNGQSIMEEMINSITAGKTPRLNLECCLRTNMDKYVNDSFG